MALDTYLEGRLCRLEKILKLQDSLRRLVRENVDDPQPQAGPLVYWPSPEQMADKIEQYRKMNKEWMGRQEVRNRLIATVEADLRRLLEEIT